MRPFSFDINLYVLASLGSIFTGLTLALLLGFTKRNGQTANLFLSSALAVIVLKTGGLTPLFLPAMGPLLYFYVRQLTCPDRRFRREDMLHFSFLFVGYWMPAWLVLISVITYLYLAHRLIEDFYRRLRPVLMDRPRFAFRRLDRALALLGLFCALSLFNDTFYFVIAFVLIGMAVEAVLKPDNDAQLAMPITDRSDAKEKGRRLKEVVATNRLYEDAELTLTTLAVKLAIHPHDLSRIINLGLEKNFSDFINEFRVREVARKMQDPAYDRLTLLGIAYESGFNSQRTFNRVFKEMTGKTPAEYKNSLKKELPIDKLATPSRIRTVILRPESPPNWAPGTLKRNIMIRNYLKIGWRNMARNRTSALINITGLTLGISVCFIIMMYVQNELGYDRFNKNSDRIVRIQFKAVMNGGEVNQASVMAPVAQAVKNSFPEVEDATRLFFLSSSKIIYGTKSFKNDGVALADPNFFNVFTLTLIEGDEKKALSQPGSIIISRATALKYFGSENPVGQALNFGNNGGYYKVTGIFDKVPDNSHFHFDMLGSLVGFKPAQSDSWMDGSFFTYLLLRPGTHIETLQAKFPAMVKKYIGPQIQQAMGLSLEQFYTKGNQLGFVLQPLTAIHLHPSAPDEPEPAGSAGYVYIFGVIAIFMLLIACINFINLATAGATKRAKEIGVRKVIGSDRQQLIAQFLVESGLLVFSALAISVVVIEIFLPVFNEISGKHLAFGFDIRLISALIGLGLIVVMLAGIYPAFFLSSFKPITVLKGKFAGNSKSFGLRGGLVIFQFFISVSLIVAMIVVYEQMRYIQNKDLGYNKDQVLTIPNSYLLGKNEKVFMAMVLRDPRVINGTLSLYKPVGTSSDDNALIHPVGHDNSTLKTENFHVDENYIPTLGMKMAAGRNFSKDMATDSSAIILNESAAKALGYTITGAIGQSIVPVISNKGKNFRYHVIGVVQDFNFKSLHENIAPMLFSLEPDGGVIFKMQTKDIQGVLAGMKKQWDTFNTGEPFAYAFLDDLYNKTYTTEQKTSALLNIFALLTVIVACLGLFGLVTYTAEQRVKEIGVRKVLGASVTQITRMLSIDFLKLVLIACLVAFPFSYWATEKWLESFAYRMTFHWWIFALAAMCALLIAFITLSFQAIKAAIANPVRSLRTE